MVKIQWSEGFSTGISYLDERNQELVKLANNMLECKDEDVNDNVVLDVLNHLIEYSTIHFIEEEMYMQNIGCPDLSSQKARHGTFRKQIFHFYLDFTKKKTNNLYRQVRDYLIYWIMCHIFYDDKQSFSLCEETI